MKYILFLLFALMPVASIADEYFAVTPSGATEMVFSGNSSTIIGKISNKCIDAGWTVISAADNSAVCEAPLSMGAICYGANVIR